MRTAFGNVEQYVPLEGWYELEYAVRTAKPSVSQLYGCDFWELLQRDPRASEAFDGAMRSASVSMTPAVTAAYNWGQFPLISGRERTEAEYQSLLRGAGFELEEVVATRSPMPSVPDTSEKLPKMDGVNRNE